MEAIAYTIVPENRPNINRWFHFISQRELDLSDVKYNTILGRVVLYYYEDRPHDVIKLLRQINEEDPVLVLNVIGEANVKKLGR